MPLTYGMNDADYLHVFREMVVPVSQALQAGDHARSAGFDIHGERSLGGMAVTERGFAGMTRMLMDMAGERCEGKLLFVLEGGYDIAALTNSVRTVIMELKGTPVYIGGEDGRCARGRAAGRLKGERGGKAILGRLLALFPDGLLQFFSHFEIGELLFRYLDYFAVLRVPSLVRLVGPQRETSEAPYFDPFAVDDRLLYSIDNGVDHYLRDFLVKVDLL